MSDAERQTGAMQRHELTVQAFLEHAAKWHPRAGVVTAGERDVDAADYRSLLRRARRLSAALRRLGVERGDTVASLAWNTRGHFELWYAAAGIGAVCHTLNPRLAADQLAAMTAMSGPRMLCYGERLEALAGDIAAATNSRPALLALDREGPGSTAALIAGERVEADWSGVREDDPAGLCFTSGTTGAPKGVLYSHRSNHLHTLRLLQADALALTAEDRVLAAVPMFHANGWGLPFAAPAVGATLVLPGRRLDGASLAQLMRCERVTVAAGVPTVWLDLADHLEKTGETLPALGRVYLGGAALPVEVQRKLEKRLGASVHTSWGMTELSPLGTISSGSVAETLAGSSGRLPIGVDLRLVDEQGAELSEQRGREGRLQVRGHSVVDRYYGAEVSALDPEGWFDTGDLANVSQAGDLTITGRAKDLIKSGGEWINPAEIERLAGGLAGVAQAAVIGRIDARWGERPVLVVELAPGIRLADAAFAIALEGQIARWWMPDAVHRVERMPLAATGKIDKVALRRAFGGTRSDLPPLASEERKRA